VHARAARAARHLLAQVVQRSLPQEQPDQATGPSELTSCSRPLSPNLVVWASQQQEHSVGLTK
jgi:hypothetical protein